MTKLELIDKITDFHPGSDVGAKGGWCYYVGGMGDHGDWYYKKLMEAPEAVLQSLLIALEVEALPPPPLSEEDQKLQNTHIGILKPNGGYVHTNALQDKIWAEMMDKIERSIMWGRNARNG